MGNANDLFKIDQIEVDFKNFEKIRLKATQNSTVILSFLIYNYNAPVDLSQYRYEVRFSLPNGNLYSEEDNVTVNGNILTVTCDSTLTQAIGEATGTLRLWTIDGKQTSLYELVVRVYGTGTGEIVSKSTISVLEHLDLSINRAVELSRNFNTDISAVKKLTEEFDSSISMATKLNNKFDSNISTATNLNNSLASNINVGTPLNSDLKNNIDKATPLNEDLKKNIVVAEPLNEELKDNIAIGKVVNSRLESNSKDLEEDLDKILGGVIFTDENGKIITSDENIPLATRNYEGMYEGYENHISNTEIHITKDERSKWNKNITDLKTHEDDTMKQITDLTNNINSVASNLKTHEDDTIKHISVEERKLLNFHSEQIKSILNLLDIALSGTAFTDENGTILINEENKIITI